MQSAVVQSKPLKANCLELRSISMLSAQSAKSEESFQLTSDVESVPEFERQFFWFIDKPWKTPDTYYITLIWFYKLPVPVACVCYD